MTSLATIRHQAKFFSVTSEPEKASRRRHDWAHFRFYRRELERALSRGPLFQPELRSAAGLALEWSMRFRLRQLMNHWRQPGWIFVTTSITSPGTVRIDIAEASKAELNSIRANRKVARNLRLREGETLRYSVFANDVHAALHAVKSFLSEFEIEQDHYRIHSAAAATAIETCGVALRSRRSNFEPVEQTAVTNDDDSDGVQLSIESIAAVKTSFGNERYSEHRRDSFDTQEKHRQRDSARHLRRGWQKQELETIVSEVGKSIALASEALEDTPPKRQQLARQLTIGNKHGGILRPSANGQQSPSSTANGVYFHPADIANMEKWVMRREAIEYLKLRRVQFARTVLAGLIAGVVAGLLFHTVFDPVGRFNIVFIVGVFATTTSAASAMVFWLRYRKGLNVWRGIRRQCKDATLPNLSHGRL